MNINVATLYIRSMKSIEEAIKQEKPFSSEIRKALVNLLFTSNHVIEQMDRFFIQFDLTHKQYNVLRIVRGAKVHPSTAYIRDRMLVKNCDSSRIVDRLIQKDLLHKRKQKEDRRQVEIELTLKGKELLQEIDDKMPQVDKIFQNLDPDEVKSLNILLDKIRIKPFKN